MIKVDLHTHSIASKDGGISLAQYKKILNNNILDVIAITDHNRIDFALKAERLLGKKKIVVGEEILTTSGEIIGLFLKTAIQPGLSIEKTIDIIKHQGGLVYVPHPLEKLRKGIDRDVINKLSDKIDILEIHNGRDMLQKNTKIVRNLSEKYNIIPVASSDAHTLRGIGHSYTLLNGYFTASTLLEILRDAKLIYARPPLYTLLAPKINKLKSILKK